MTTDEAITCRYCGAGIEPGRSRGSGWAAVDGADCDPAKPGHAPRLPEPMQRWHQASTGEWTRAGVVAGDRVRTEHHDIAEINRREERTVYVLTPLGQRPPRDDDDPRTSGGGRPAVGDVP